MAKLQVNQQQQYLSFSLAGNLFAVEVSQVREILDFTPVTKVPQVPAYMLGVINLRGSVVPVFDLRRKLGMSEGEKTRDTCIVVMEVGVAEETITVGAVADAVQEVMDLADSEIEPPPRLSTALNTEIIRGMGKKGDGFLILLDINRVFANEEIELFHSNQQETLVQGG